MVPLETAGFFLDVVWRLRINSAPVKICSYFNKYQSLAGCGANMRYVFTDEKVLDYKTILS